MMNQAEFVKRYRPTLDRHVSFEKVLTVHEYDVMGIFRRSSHVMPIVHGKGLTYELPRNHTLHPPPEAVPAGHVAVYAPSTGRWHVLEDHRGETWKNMAGERVVVWRPGNPVSWGYQR